MLPQRTRRKFRSASDLRYLHYVVNELRNTSIRVANLRVDDEIRQRRHFVWCGYAREILDFARASLPVEALRVPLLACFYRRADVNLVKRSQARGPRLLPI